MNVKEDHYSAHTVPAAPLQPYQYESLPSARHIRLLRCSKVSASSMHIARSLETVSLDGCHPFWALSYTWGDALFSDEAGATSTPVRCDEFLEVDGVHIQITRNLMDAITTALDDLVLKSDDQYYFWIDAICINQEDYDERSSQVALMGDIYSSAVAALVWLGRDTSDLDGFCRIHERVVPLFHAERCPERDKLLSIRPSDPEVLTLLEIDSFEEWYSDWAAYFRFLHRRRWFSRAWVMQEVSLAEHVEFICGSAIPSSWEEIFGMSIFLAAVDWEDELRSRVTLSPVKNAGERPCPGFRTFGMMRSFVSGSKHPSPHGGWLTTSQRFRTKPWHPPPEILWAAERMAGATTDAETWYFGVFHLLEINQISCATDLRDKIYSILGILDTTRPLTLPNPFRVDYAASVEDVYMEVAKILYENLPFLLLLSFARETSYKRVERLPSWVPDYSEPPKWHSLTRLGSRLNGVNADLSDIFTKTDPLYDASLARSAPRAPRSICDRTLLVEGALFERIVDCTIPVDSIPSIINELEENNHSPRCKHMLRFFGIICPPDGVYAQTQEPVDEALWRTMIANCSNNTYPAEAEIGEVFKAFMAYASVLIYSNYETTTDVMTMCFSLVGPIMKRLFAADDADSMAEQVTHYLNDSRFGQGERFLSLLRHGPGFGRCIYLTENGHLGLGPTGLRHGDAIWLLRGARVPFVLRENAEEEGYNLLGETYVHGFMHGEMLSDELKKRLNPVQIV